jgi:predicted Fe-Mo cluster-binding NifX family protein
VLHAAVRVPGVMKRVREFDAMKVAVASEDGRVLSRHFGKSTCLLVFEIDGNTIRGEVTRIAIDDRAVFCECRTSRASADLTRRRDRLVQAVQDCRVVLCGGMGWRVAGELILRGVNPLVITGQLSPREAVECYLAGTLQPAAGFCRRKP